MLILEVISIYGYLYSAFLLISSLLRSHLSRRCFAHRFIELNLFKEKSAEVLAVEVLLLEFDLDLLVRAHLLLGLLDLLKECMVEGLVHGYSEVRIENQNALQQVHSVCPSPWVERVQVDPRLVREGLEVLQGLGVSHVGLVVVGGGADNFENDSKLVILRKRESLSLLTGIPVGREWETRFSREQRLSIQIGWRTFLHHSEQLSEYASD